MKLCELIKRGRRAIDISKTQLAEKVGCTTRAIEYWESGERKISLENADKVFKALDITVCIGKRKNKVVKVRNIEMFDNKELTRIMSMVVNESVKIQKEINECNSGLQKESLERDLATVNSIGSKISKVINADLQQEEKICCPNCGSSDLSKFNDDDETPVFVCENCDYEFPESEVE